MKHLIFILLMILNSFSIIAQNYFEIGMDYSNVGQYSKADSCFLLQLKAHPGDRNAWFNHGAMKLYEGDTCSFCNEMHKICSFGSDKVACGLFYSICGTADTVYFNKDYIRVEKKKSRFTEITETNKCTDYKLVTVHDKYNWDKSIIVGSDFINPVKTNIIAAYEIYTDNNRVFTFSLTPPSYPGGEDARYDFKLKNYDIKKAKQELKLEKFVANIEYIVDKNGVIRNVKLISTNKDIDKTEDLTKYINLIIAAMPDQIPAKYRGVNVDYLVRDSISFW